MGARWRALHIRGRQRQALPGGMLEFDHRVPVAQGGQGTVENVRLVCRAHNQYAAERAFGADFIHAKRRAARERAATGGDVSGRPRVRTGSRP